MPGYGGFDFASPAQYGDWAQYAGLNRTTGEMEGTPAPVQGVPPPENPMEAIQQRFSAAQNKVGGRVNQAMNMMGMAPQAPSAIQAPAASEMLSGGFDYTAGLAELML